MRDEKCETSLANDSAPFGFDCSAATDASGFCSSAAVAHGSTFFDASPIVTTTDVTP